MPSVEGVTKRRDRATASLAVLPARIQRVAREAAAMLDCRVPLLVSGGSAAERESLARWIHAARDAKGPFVAIQCRRGDAARLDASLAVAQTGTCYLDDIAVLDRPMQERVSAFLERGGSSNLITSTSSEPRDLIDGAFSTALFYRLNVIHLVIDPPRSRRRDA